MVEVVILLGGNLGDVRGAFKGCRELLSKRVGEIVSTSHEAESEAWGFSSELTFLNQAVLLRTTLSPAELLSQTQSIEREMGRDRVAECAQKVVTGERYAERVIDVDIITYSSEVVRQQGLEIPHPRMQEREFVLRPMVEVAPKWRHPILNVTTEELLKSVKL